MAETIVVIERGLKWTAYFENAPHKKVTDSQRSRAIGSLIEDYADHCGITIRVGTVEDEAAVTGTKTYAELEADLKAAQDKLSTEDGFGSVWGPCPTHGTKMQVVRPGKATCPKCDDEWFEENREPVVPERVDAAPV
jgi:hypothetical protein